MRRRVVLFLPVLLSVLVGASPALAWTWPVAGPVVRPFTYRGAPYAGGQHRGIDIGAPPGTVVAAPVDGRVTFAGTVPGGGPTITVLTADGYAVTLQHLAEVDVRRGDPVVEGQPLAHVGVADDPVVAAPHVHLGVRDPAGEYVDPLPLLERGPAAPPEPPGPIEEPTRPSPAPPADIDPSPPAVEQPAPVTTPVAPPASDPVSAPPADAPGAPVAPSDAPVEVPDAAPGAPAVGPVSEATRVDVPVRRRSGARGPAPMPVPSPVAPHATTATATGTRAAGPGDRVRGADPDPHRASEPSRGPAPARAHAGRQSDPGTAGQRSRPGERVVDRRAPAAPSEGKARLGDDAPVSAVTRRAARPRLDAARPAEPASPSAPTGAPGQALPEVVRVEPPAAGATPGRVADPRRAPTRGAPAWQLLLSGALAGVAALAAVVVLLRRRGGSPAVDRRRASPRAGLPLVARAARDTRPRRRGEGDRRWSSVRSAAPPSSRIRAGRGRR